MDKGNFSKNTYIAVEISSFTAFIIAVSPNKISFILIPPKAENHKKVTAAGSRSTPNINSLMVRDRKSTRLNSSHVAISYAVFCLKKKKNNNEYNHANQCGCAGVRAAC